MSVAPSLPLAIHIDCTRYARGLFIGGQWLPGDGIDVVDPSTEQVLAKHRLAQGNQPIAGGGFFEITDAHEVRRYPVASQQHFLADLAVAGLVRYPQTM